MVCPYFDGDIRVDNRWIVAQTLWITTHFQSMTCGRLASIHNRAELSTAVFHASSTGLEPRDLR
jgi:hypothetical protein